MDDDQFDKTDPANTPHAFQSVAFSTMGHPLSFRGPCKVCKRGSGHHVHETDPANTPHRYVAAKDQATGARCCELCGRGSGHHVHLCVDTVFVSAVPALETLIGTPSAIGEAFDRTFSPDRPNPLAFPAPPRWVKGAPEPERHEFLPVRGHVSIGGEQLTCAECGELAGNGKKHRAPTGDLFEPERHTFISGTDLQLGRCAECGELEGNGNVHTDPPAEPHVFKPPTDEFGTVHRWNDPDCTECGGKEDDDKLHRVPAEPHVFIRQTAYVDGDYPYETCAVCGGREDDGKKHFAIQYIAPEPYEPENELADVRTDQINRPAHYTAHPSGIECIQITEHMSFPLGNAVKYIWRADLKGDAVADLEKAVWYLNRELDRRNGKTTKY